MTRSLRLFLALLSVVVTLALPSGALAQLPANPLAPKPPPAPKPAAAPEPQLTPAQAQMALEVLSDDAKRAQVLAVLTAIVKAAPAVAGQPGAAAAPASGAKPALPLPLAPDSVGAQLLVGASEQISDLSHTLMDTAQTLTNFPLLSDWLINLVRDPAARAAIVDAAWKLALVLLGGLAVEYGVSRLLRRPMAALERRAPNGAMPADPRAGEDGGEEPPGTPTVEANLAGQSDAGVAEASDPVAGEAGDRQDGHRRRRPSALTLVRRLPFVLGRFVLDVLPVFAFVAVGYFLAGTRLGQPSTSRLVILAVLNSYVVCRLILCVTRVVFAPSAPRLRLFHLSDAAARYAMRWTRRLTVVAVVGYAVTEVGLLFGLYRAAHDALLKIVSLIDHVLLVVIVLQIRHKVARRIRAREGASGLSTLIRARFAAAWHWIAIFYIVALWLVWAFEVPNGYARLLRFFIANVAIITVARIVGILAVGAAEKALRISPETAARYPGLEERARNYFPVARAIVTVIVFGVAGVALVEAWGFDSLSWFTAGALGGRVLQATLVMGVTLLVALIVWELVNAGIQNHLDRLAREQQLARSARLRTLLPMARTTLLTSICLFAGLTVLSEIGVNIAPLLAGAGVIGLAIGFGSQKLVQDIITGLFLLLENAMQVGDVVSLGGLSGTVENLSIRTIRLRALDGSVHIVPFSAVTTVTNMTRDYGYALIDISVGLNEEPEPVIKVVKEVAARMREEARWKSALRDDLEVMGVEKFVDLAWVLRVRIKTLPGQRWAVSRELNKRIKVRFDEEAIESPFTSHRALGLSVTPAPAPPPVPAAATVESPA